MSQMVGMPDWAVETTFETLDGMRLKGGVYQYLYKRDKSPAVKLLGYLAAIVGIGSMVLSPVFGVVVLLGAGGIIAYHSGIEIRVSSREYRLMHALGTKGFGDWQPLPGLKCVSLFKTRLTSRTYGRSNASFTSTDTVYQVNLATEQNKRILLYESQTLNQSLDFANQCAAHLQLPVWDATEREGRWLER